LLTGCGPASLRAHLPQRPQISLFQNTSLVQTAPRDLLPPQGQPFENLQELNEQPADNQSLVHLASAGIGEAALFQRWRRQDGALVTYGLPSTATPATTTYPAWIQVDLGRYASAADAQGMFHVIENEPVKIGTVSRLTTSGLGANSFAYSMQLPGISMRLAVFQERNFVGRILSTGPSGSPLPGMTGTVAQRTYDLIANAK
jgi:hypothetical protein